MSSLNSQLEAPKDWATFILWVEGNSTISYHSKILILLLISFNPYIKYSLLGLLGLAFGIHNSATAKDSRRAPKGLLEMLPSYVFPFLTWSVTHILTTSARLHVICAFSAQQDPISLLESDLPKPRCRKCSQVDGQSKWSTGLTGFHLFSYHSPVLLASDFTSYIFPLEWKFVIFIWEFI